MSLSLISGTKTIKPYRMTVIGRPKIGKSTFGASAENPIFIPTESGLENIEANSFPLCKTLDQFMGYMTTLYVEDHEFKTLCIDSLDWLERLIHKKVCEDQNDQKIKCIEDIGYGKGYKFALPYWETFIDALEALRNDKSMQVILLAHCEVKRHEDPRMDAYDRYVIKIHKSAAEMLIEFCDLIGFADYVTSIKKEDSGFGAKRTRAESVNLRKLYFDQNAAFTAGNRIPGMPDSVDLNYQSFRAALDAARGA